MMNRKLLFGLLAAMLLTACEKGLEDDIADVSPAGQVTNSLLQVRTRGTSPGDEAFSCLAPCPLPPAPCSLLLAPCSLPLAPCPLQSCLTFCLTPNWGGAIAISEKRCTFAVSKVHKTIDVEISKPFLFTISIHLLKYRRNKLCHCFIDCIKAPMKSPV